MKKITILVLLIVYNYSLGMEQQISTNVPTEQHNNNHRIEVCGDSSANEKQSNKCEQKKCGQFSKRISNPLLHFFVPCGILSVVLTIVIVSIWAK